MITPDIVGTLRNAVLHREWELRANCAEALEKIIVHAPNLVTSGLVESLQRGAAGNSSALVALGLAALQKPEYAGEIRETLSQIRADSTDSEVDRICDRFIRWIDQPREIISHLRSLESTLLVPEAMPAYEILIRRLHPVARLLELGNRGLSSHSNLHVREMAHRILMRAQAEAALTEESVSATAVFIQSSDHPVLQSGHGSLILIDSGSPASSTFPRFRVQGTARDGAAQLVTLRDAEGRTLIVRGPTETEGRPLREGDMVAFLRPVMGGSGPREEEAAAFLRIAGSTSEPSALVVLARGIFTRPGRRSWAILSALADIFPRLPEEVRSELAREVADLQEDPTYYPTIFDFLNRIVPSLATGERTQYADLAFSILRELAFRPGNEEVFDAWGIGPQRFAELIKSLPEIADRRRLTAGLERMNLNPRVRCRIWAKLLPALEERDRMDYANSMFEDWTSTELGSYDARDILVSLTGSLSLLPVLERSRILRNIAQRLNQLRGRALNSEFEEMLRQLGPAEFLGLISELASSGQGTEGPAWREMGLLLRPFSNSTLLGVEGIRSLIRESIRLRERFLGDREAGRLGESDFDQVQARLYAALAENLHFARHLPELIEELRRVPDSAVYQRDLARILGVVAGRLRTNSAEVFEDLRDAIESLSVDPVDRLVALSHLVSRPGLSREFRDSTFGIIAGMLREIGRDLRISVEERLLQARDILRRNRSLRPEQRQQALDSIQTRLGERPERG